MKSPQHWRFVRVMHEWLDILQKTFTNEFSQIHFSICIWYVLHGDGSVEKMEGDKRLDRLPHICVGNLTIIGSENGLAPVCRQAIIWINDGILLIGPEETNFNEILIEILTFSFKRMCFKVSSAKWRPFCFGPNVLSECVTRPKCLKWTTE